MNNNNKIYEKNARNFDKKHKQFYKIVFIRFMKEVEKKFISKFKFEGDERFTKAKQKTFFKGVFRNGYASVTNVLPSQLKDNELVDEILKEMDENPFKALAVVPQIFDDDGLVKWGEGIVNMRSNDDTQKVYEVNRKNSAFLQFDSQYGNGFEKWLPYAYMFATSELVMKKKLTLADSKIAGNTQNNNDLDSTFQDIYDTSKSFIKLNPSTQSSLTSDKHELIKTTDLLSDKISKSDMSAGETLLDILEFMEQHKNVWYHLLGERVNVNKKGDRNISDEFTSDEVHFKIAQQEFRDFLDIFMEQYKEVHGKELILIDLEEETLKELEEKQVKLAGQAGNKGEDNENNKDK